MARLLQCELPTNAANQQVQDVSTSVAKSVDDGQSFTYLQLVGAAQGPVTVTDGTKTVCGQATCTGRWIYEVPFLIEDATDPNPARAFKLLAHKYFLYPPAGAANEHEHPLGAIVMWTASSPDGTWSAETPVLTWNLTSPEIPSATNINTLNANLASCLLLTEGSASVVGNAIDLAFNCTYASGSAYLGNVVLLRSADHAETFSYVSTLLTPSDASIVSGDNFLNAPGLLPTSGSPPVLILTPSTATGTYRGCLVIPFADEQAGTLIRDNNQLPVSILSLPTLSGHFGGACAWDRGIAALPGILTDDLNPMLPQSFGIVGTGTRL